MLNADCSIANISVKRDDTNAMQYRMYRHVFRLAHGTVFFCVIISKDKSLQSKNETFGLNAYLE
ncbi:hypothetical protein CN563_11105 [Bacillus sp. AFS026049]|uniref:hypothetical protein n=1 Tax=Peribacillus frigoritolerans TaxID=450367 RepID=UPI000BEDE9B2|nr:hypothetical protein [Peribacillus frigoritolerans]PEF38527.1 hypothetical protein CON84_13355 [Bacillus sp. AFS094228]PEO47510.1 hypothetical protein CN563_11105 [Bacillus sp. AFS026049]MCR8870096.1 hypothetical protein [Peribacillus frigoritolerans]WHX65026.1 hypothetical protein QNH26_15035 [Peribacillus frigoritolerans]WVN09006.1 hypothetical protein V2I71_15545 [Peribacillus frigoritolerans]